MTGQRRWIALHVHYQGDLTRLLIEGVAPLLDAERSWFFLRYWDGGNHLRLRVDAGTGGSGPDIAAALTAEIETYLRHRPSAGTFATEDYRRVAAALAAVEQLDRFSPVMVPNNTVQRASYEPEYRRYGTGADLDAVERHFCESSAIALALLKAGSTAGQRHTVALAALVLAALHGGRAPVSGRGLRPARELPLSPSVLDLVTRMRELARSDQPGSDVTWRWNASLGDLRAVLGPGPRTAGVLDTCAHLFCNRIGISLPEEGVLRDLADRALTTTTEEAPCPG